MTLREPVNLRAGGNLVATLCAALVVSAAGTSLAVPFTQPTGLNPGDEYRLVFVTSTQRDATSSNIADYNAFVTAAANSSPELAALATTWTAIASTLSVDARDNTSTNYSSAIGVPVYNLADDAVASSNADLWDGTLLSPIAYDEAGNYLATIVFSGTLQSGIADNPTELAGGSGNSTYANSNSVIHSWIDSTSQTASGTSRSFYAISDVLVAVPEPGTAVLLTLGLVGLGAVRRRVEAR